MASDYKVFGPCTPMIKIGAGAWAMLGIALDNGTVELDIKEIDRMADSAGQAVPADIQAMGTQAFISLRLASWDNSIYSSLLALADGGNVPGRLLGTSASVFQLWLPTTTDLPWHFPTCKLTPTNENPGTKASDLSLRIRAWRYVPGNVATVTGIALYNRATPS